jgi:hypothetical protein
MKKLFFAFLLFPLLCFRCTNKGATPTRPKKNVTTRENDSLPGAEKPVIVDTILYNKKLLELAQNKRGDKWPVKTDYPLAGALLPFNRIVAFYGNFYSAGMGILGELSHDELLKKVKAELENWKSADSLTPVIPAIHYIAITAQGSNGNKSKYRLRMPADQLKKAIDLATEINGIVFLDIQVGHSTLQEEIPALDSFLKLPNVHLGIDPEYSMKNGKVPSTSIGTFDASDINFASEYLVKLVKENDLSPKILVVHRFTQGMVTNYKKIITRPEVQVVINMDGFGSPAKKIDSYKGWVSKEPVQFTGFKLFYKQDHPVMKPQDVLKLYPRPIYIQYQ